MTSGREDRTAASSVHAEVAFLLEDVPAEGVDWRYRVRVADGGASGWVEVQGIGEPPDPAAARALVLDACRDLPPGGRLPLLEALSPFVFGAGPA
jgi:hypothetical protein